LFLPLCSRPCTRRRSASTAVLHLGVRCADGQSGVSRPACAEQAWRLVGDPREPATGGGCRAEREHGIWECTRCYLCNERCPKGVDPRDAIAKLGAEPSRPASRANRGARHAAGSSPRRVHRLAARERAGREDARRRRLGHEDPACACASSVAARPPLTATAPQGESLEPARALQRIVAGQDRRARGIVSGRAGAGPDRARPRARAAGAGSGGF